MVKQGWALLEEFYSRRTVKGSHKSPDRVRNANSRNIIPGRTETRAAGVEQNTRHKAEPSTLYQIYIDAIIN